MGISGKTLETVERLESKIDRLPQSQPSDPISPPFRAPKPPKQFVQRPVEFERLVERLLAGDSQRTVGITTALQGGGGFGKTTLAHLP